MLSNLACIFFLKLKVMIMVNDHHYGVDTLCNFILDIAMLSILSIVTMLMVTIMVCVACELHIHVNMYVVA